jgi:hypothetical protein
MLFSSLALAVAAAAAVPWVQQEEVEEGEERGASAGARCTRVLPVVARHGMHVEPRDGYKHLPQTMKLK